MKGGGYEVAGGLRFSGRRPRRSLRRALRVRRRPYGVDKVVSSE
jgi:hypothetical protein